MKMGIKAKILISTSLVVVVSLLISGSITYAYFVNILKDQAVKDDSMRLNQTKSHIEYIIDDIRKFSYNIALDSDVQEYVNLKEWGSSLDELRSIEKIRKRLKDFKNLREYIQSAAIIRMDGDVHSDNDAFDEYMKEHLSDEWFKRYERNPSQSYFSNPHIVKSDISTEDNVISYVTEVRNIDDPTQPLGYIVLNIFVTHFEKSIKPESEGFDAYFWFGADNLVIYGKNAENSYIRHELLPKLELKDSMHDQNIIYPKSGYVISSGPMSNGWQLVSFTSNSSLFKRTNYILVIFIIFTIACLILIILIIMPVVLGITKPVTDLTKAMGKVSGGNMDINLSITSGDEIQILGEGFNKMIHELKSYIAKSVEFEKTKRNMEFNLLLSQINPHFIYNTLNTVIYLARKNNNEDIAQMMDSFIRILQDAVKINEQGVFATVRQEIDVARHYVNIQRYRYPERFNVIWNECDDIMDAWIPKTMLQPLIENALIHGIFPSERSGEINVSIKKQNAELIIEVCDNGVGIDSDTIKRLLGKKAVQEDKSVMRSIGIPNIIDRISYLYGEGYGVSIESKLDEWAMITVRIPLSNQIPK